MSPDQVIPVSQQGGRRQVQSGSVGPAETPKDRRKRGTEDTQDRQTDTQEQQPARRAAGAAMREQINTFETVFNVEQFLVRRVDVFGHWFTAKGRAGSCTRFVFLWEHPHGLIRTRQLLVEPADRSAFPQVN